jgi:hypothetical protein
LRDIDLDQRFEENERALSMLFESPKAPALSSYDDGAMCFIQASWVVESHGDTTLDSRCALTVRFSDEQIQRYARMDTAQRIVVRERLLEMVRDRLPADGAVPLQGDCAVDLHVDDPLLDVAQRPESY